MQRRGRLEHVFENLVPGFVVALSEAAALELAEHPLVESVEEVSEMTFSQVQYNAPWHLDRIDQRPLPLNGSYKSYCVVNAVHAYVIDTGIRASHAEFMANGVSRVIAGKNFVSGDTCSSGRAGPAPSA